jgi:hypothetical protein
LQETNNAIGLDSTPFATQVTTSNEQSFGLSYLPTNQYTSLPNPNGQEIAQGGQKYLLHGENDMTNVYPRYIVLPVAGVDASAMYPNYSNSSAMHVPEPPLGSTSPALIDTSGTESTKNSFSTSPSPPGTSRAATQPQTFTNHKDLIRNAATPNRTDFSAKAQIIRTARSRTGRTFNFTWTEHYDILFHSVLAARISELNTKLSTGLTRERLIREISPKDVPADFLPLIVFSRTGLQQRIDWMWCSEHLELMQDLDLSIPDFDLEQLDTVVKKTGAWMLAGRTPEHEEESST